MHTIRAKLFNAEIDTLKVNVKFTDKDKVCGLFEFKEVAYE